MIYIYSKTKIGLLLNVLDEEKKFVAFWRHWGDSASGIAAFTGQTYKSSQFQLVISASKDLEHATHESEPPLLSKTRYSDNLKVETTVVGNSKIHAVVAVASP